MNVMNDIAQKDNIQIGYYNRENILRIFKLIDQLSPEVNRDLKIQDGREDLICSTCYLMFCV